VFKSPYWHWESGDFSKRKDYLDGDKQFLVTKNVACLKRVNKGGVGVGVGESEEIVDDKEDTGDDYMNIIIISNNALKEEGDRMNDDEILPEIQTGNESPKVEVKKDNEKEEEEEIPDIDDFSGLNIQEETDHVVSTSTSNHNNNHNNDAGDNPSSNILTDNVRTYDLFITYDKYYQCPRLWLCGYDSNRKRPLSIEEVFEDVSEDHAKKTITLEPFPHYSSTTTNNNTEMLTVHPCRHANVMKRIIDRMVESSESSSSAAATEVEACLIVFLKFMSCIVPTIEYDHTSGVKAAGLKK
jgi:ubiquitin-like-conjugating enzyme ATG3